MSNKGASAASGAVSGATAGLALGGPVGAGIGGAVGLLGGLLSGGDDDAQKAEAARQAALQQWLNINVPNPNDQKIALQQYHSTGRLDPKMEQAFNQSQSEMNNVQTDPTTRAAQMSALAKFQNISNSNGLDAQAQASNQQSINQLNTNTRGQRDALIQSAAQRGTGGSGASLAAQMLAGQQDANTASSQGMQNAASAQQRALQAMSQGASLAGNMNSADFQQQSQKAAAQDAINRFNTANSQSVANNNVNSTNQANATNLAASQALANQNTGLYNQQEIQNKGTVQQGYDNQLKQVAGATGQYGAVASADQANQAASDKQWGGIQQAIGQGAAAYGQYANNLKKTKDDTETEEA